MDQVTKVLLQDLPTGAPAVLSEFVSLPLPLTAVPPLLLRARCLVYCSHGNMHGDMALSPEKPLSPGKPPTSSKGDTRNSQLGRHWEGTELTGVIVGDSLQRGGRECVVAGEDIFGHC